MSVESLFATVRGLADPPVWSKGVELARNAEFRRESSTDDVVVRVIPGRAGLSPRVSLNVTDEVWQCDCESESDPCQHVVAALIALRQGTLSSTAKSATTAHVEYHFETINRSLSFTRKIVWETGALQVERSLAASLDALFKAAGAPRGVSLDEVDDRIDYVLGDRKHGILEPRVMALLIPALAESKVFVDGRPLRAGRDSISPEVEVVDEGEGFRIRRKAAERPTTVFLNGAAICEDELRVVLDSKLSGDDAAMLSGDGLYVPRERAHEIALTLLPRLSRALPVRLLTTRTPRVVKAPPRIVIDTATDSTGTTLTVVPRLVYGDPIIAEVRRDELQLHDKSEIPSRDSSAERSLAMELRKRLGLEIGQIHTWSGEAAVGIGSELSNFSRHVTVQGEGVRAFATVARLAPSFTESGEIVFEGTVSGQGIVDAARVLEAFRDGRRYLHVPGAGWFSLPEKWLAEYAEIITRLLDARVEGEEKRYAPLLIEAAEALKLPLPARLEDFKCALVEGKLPLAALPEDLTAELRPYQQQGVNWLSWLRNNDLGGLLADDMGLGKTLQTLCALRGRTLVVAPTSVLYTWQEQIRKFRSNIRVSIYHGGRRLLEQDAEITLTTYAILRLDREQLCEVGWDTVVLDEAHTIKNPESQVAQAAYALRGKFRLSLSGTPIENSLTDLWSQFRFFAPGLLGSRSQFEKEFAEPIETGSIERGIRLKKITKPFILRRLKSEVAKDLPPKTEQILYCELDETERKTYDALLAAARSEVLEKLASGATPFSVFELLLRLRQACCHGALLPGGTTGNSSKLEALRSTVEEVVAEGHKVLVFSQWTSFLDLIGRGLTESGVIHSRLDGSTPNRGEVVKRFQEDPSVHVMLLSLKAGGVGLTLTAADYVFITDPWWNPSAEDQASDRAHRIGQENPVFVQRLVARNTIEERIIALQEQKRELVRAVLDGSQAVPLTAEDIVGLLG